MNYMHLVSLCMQLNMYFYREEQHFSCHFLLDETDSYYFSWICRKNARSFCSVSMQKLLYQAARYKEIQADCKVYVYVCAVVCDLSLQNISEFCILLLASTRIVYGVHFVLIYCYCLMPTANLTLPMLY